MLFLIFAILAILTMFASAFNAKVGTASNSWNLFSLAWAFAFVALFVRLSGVDLGL